MAEPFIGEVDQFGFSFVPENWGNCTGALISISQNQALFALLGTAYGGDGRSNFALPDLRGKVAISQGQHPGSRFDWRTGHSGGTESWALRADELAQHSHSAAFSAAGEVSVDVQVSTDSATQNVPKDNSYVAVNMQGSDPGILSFRTDAGNGTDKLGGISGSAVSSGSVAVGGTGGNTRFSLTQPSLILNYCIAMQGLFPSRN